MMKTSSSMRSPVILLVGQTHLRITSVCNLSFYQMPNVDYVQVRAQTISTTLTCRATEVIPMADVGDVYNVLTGQEVMNEFIIRRNRSSSTIYLTSPAREVIVKVGRHTTVSVHALITSCVGHPTGQESSQGHTNAPCRTLLSVLKRSSYVVTCWSPQRRPE